MDIAGLDLRLITFFVLGILRRNAGNALPDMTLHA